MPQLTDLTANPIDTMPTIETPSLRRDLLELIPAALETSSAVWDDGLHCEIATTFAEVLSHRDAWANLAQDLIEPNVFYEPFVLLPALEAFTAQPLRFVFIYRNGRSPQTPRQLCGFFPFVESRSSRLRGRVWQLWGHDYCFLRTPLLRRSLEGPCLDTLLDWISDSPTGPAILDCPGVCGDQQFIHGLTEAVSKRSLLVEHVESHVRAILHRVPDWRKYVASTVSSHHRRELRRQWRRLGELGQIDHRTLTHECELFHWIESFISLESLGWKGADGTALAVNPIAADYFRTVLTSAFHSQRLQMSSIHLNGEPIAMKVNLLATPGAFGFKIAYDERYAKYSPGVQLELENLRSFHEETPFTWMDSCAAPHHPMINRIWTERRLIHHLRISTGNWRGNLTIGTRTLLRSIRRSLR